MTYNDRKIKAQELVRQDRYPEALNEYAILFREKPEDEENKKQFTFLYGRIRDGYYDFEPETSEQYAMRGLAKFQNKEYENSIDDYSKALTLDSNNHYAFRCRSFSFLFLRRIEDAITDLNKAIKIKPTGEYYDDLASIYAALNDMETAFKCHEKAIIISPDNERLWYNFGVDLAQTDQTKEALKKFDKAIELWPKYQDAIDNRNHILEHFSDKIK